MSVENSPLRGQALSYRGFQDKELDSPLDRSTPLFLDRVHQDLTENPTLLVSNDNQIRILCVLNEYFPDGLKTIQISDAVHIHRSTVSVITRELLEIKLIEKTIVPGTENHINPTQLFRLSEEFRKEVQAFLALKIKAKPDLWAVYPPAQSSIDDSDDESEQFTEVQDLESTRSDTMPSQAAVNQNFDGKFQEQVKEGFKKIIHRMLMMQREIDELRQRLDEKPSVQTDLSEVFDIFDSFDSHVEREVK